MVLEKTPESPWDSKDIKPVLTKINLEHLEGLMLKLKLQYFAHLMWTADALEKVPHAGKDWGQKEKRASEDELAGRHHQYNGYKLGKLWEMMRDREAWHATVPGVTKHQTRLGDWTIATHHSINFWLIKTDALIL